MLKVYYNYLLEVHREWIEQKESETWKKEKIVRVCSCWVDSPLFLFLLVSTCACVEYFGRALESLIKKVTVHLIHGKMKHKRNKIFADFRALKRSASAANARTALVQPRCRCHFNHSPICAPVGSWCARTWWPEASISPTSTGCCSTIPPAVPGEPERWSLSVPVWF